MRESHARQKKWISGFSKPDAVQKATENLGWHPCVLVLDMYQNFDKVAPYIGVIIPVALTVSVGTIQCRQLAANAGDEYNLRFSMLGDGMATVLAALCGSPYGMTVFIGHSAFKAMGAKIGYSILCAIAILVVAFSGVTALIGAVFPDQALNPILLFVGLAICTDALSVTPAHHWPAFMLSLVPCFCNWCSEQAEALVRVACSYPGSHCVPIPDAGIWTLDPSGSLRGLYALSQGYLLTSILLTSMLVFVIDREFMIASGWALVTALCASCGLIHSETLFLPWVGPAKPSGPYIADQLDLHWSFAGAYFMLWVIFATCAMLQWKGYIPKGPIEEGEFHHESFIQHTDLFEPQVSSNHP